MVCLLAAPWVQLSVSAGNGWPHNALLRHHWLMTISCHFRHCKALLVASLTHISGAITSTLTFAFTFLPPPRRGYAIGAVCLSICQQDYCKSTQPISLKLGVMTGPINRKNWLTFDGDPVPDTDSDCGIKDFGFISISRHQPIFTTLGEMTDEDVVMNLQHFGTDPADIRIRTQIKSWNLDSNPGSLLVEVRRLGGGLRSPSTLSSETLMSAYLLTYTLNILGL